MRGKALYKVNLNKKAIEDYTRAIDLGCKDAEIYSDRGLAYFNEKEYVEAIKDYTEVIRLKPEWVTAYYKRGRVYYEAGKDVEAIKDYTEVIRLKPELAEAYYERGRASYRAGKYVEAIKDCTEAIRLEPEWAVAYNNRGLAYFEVGKYVEAIKDYTEAIKLDSDCSRAYYNRGVAYYNEKEYGKATEDYTCVINLGCKDVEIYYNRGKAYSREEEYEKAIEDYTYAIDLGHVFGKIYYYRGIACYKEKRYVEAIGDYTRAINLGYKNAEIYFNRGRAYWIEKDYKNTIKDCVTFYSILDSDLFDCSIDWQNFLEFIEEDSFHWLLANAAKCYSEKNYELALGFCKQIIDSRVDIPFSEFFCFRAKLYIKVGAFSDAEKDCNSILEENPDHVTARQLLANISTKKEEQVERQERIDLYKNRLNGSCSEYERREALNGLKEIMCLRIDPLNFQNILEKLIEYFNMETDEDLRYLAVEVLGEMGERSINPRGREKIIAALIYSMANDFLKIKKASAMFLCRIAASNVNSEFNRKIINAFIQTLEGRRHKLLVSEDLSVELKEFVETLINRAYWKDKTERGLVKIGEVLLKLTGEIGSHAVGHGLGAAVFSASHSPVSFNKEKREEQLKKGIDKIVINRDIEGKIRVTINEKHISKVKFEDLPEVKTLLNFLVFMNNKKQIFYKKDFTWEYHIIETPRLGITFYDEKNRKAIIEIHKPVLLSENFEKSKVREGEVLYKETVLRTEDKNVLISRINRMIRGVNTDAELLPDVISSKEDINKFEAYLRILSYKEYEEFFIDLEDFSWKKYQDSIIYLYEQEILDDTKLLSEVLGRQDSFRANDINLCSELIKGGVQAVLQCYIDEVIIDTELRSA